jgi:Bacterial regulatory helix-turn-helix protein, lysR family
VAGPLTRLKGHRLGSCSGRGFPHQHHEESPIAQPRPSAGPTPIDLRRLSYFVAVAEELSFSGATGRAGVSQQALSSQIRSLEEEIGCLLFLRTTRRVELTAAGRALLPQAQVSLAAAAEALGNARAAVPESRYKL